MSHGLFNPAIKWHIKRRDNCHEKEALYNSLKIFMVTVDKAKKKNHTKVEFCAHGRNIEKWFRSIQ